MSDQDLDDAIRLAHRALVLVAKGVGERTAVRRVAASEPSLSKTRSRALDLVVGTVREQDLLDKTVKSVIKDREVPLSTLQIFRLATHLRGSAKTERSFQQTRQIFRSITPTRDARNLELLFGSLQTVKLDQFFQDLSDSERVALRTHHQVWWVEYCFNLLGRGEAIKFLSSAPRPRYVRINPLKNGGRVSLPVRAKHLKEHLKESRSQRGVYSLAGSASRFSQFFEQGLFQIQDLASFLAVKAANPTPGNEALDLCAAPGTKTATLAQLMRNRGRILSVDYSRTRMRSWRRETDRLGVKIAEPLVCDVGKLALRNSFDLILIDPPCSGTGIFDRNPAMKWHLLPESLMSYANLQRTFLDAASPLLRENGRMLYCTCSITLEENENVVASFLKMHPEFETRPILKEYGSPGLGGLADCRRFYPHRDGTAGYFVALMQRPN